MTIDPPSSFPDHPSDEIRPITALFADVVGSTALGERLRPDEIKSLIGECVSRMSDVVVSYGGTVTAYMGDGIASFFGLEGAKEDDAVRAGLAALKIIGVIGQYALEIDSAWGIKDFAVRIGINTGRAGTGPLGLDDRTRVAIGDPVNVAARLQSCAEPQTVLVGASVAASLGSTFQLERVGEVTIRGRETTVEAWKLLRYMGERKTHVYSGKFVGREEELDRFEGALSDLWSGRGQVLFLLGDAGAGKTRLLAELRSRHSADVSWLHGHCLGRPLELPYRPFVDILRSWLGLDDDAPSVVTRVRLVARLKELLGDQANDAIESLSRLLGIEPDLSAEGPSARLAPEALLGSIRAAYVEWIQAVARGSPLVIAIDDLHRADEATLQLAMEVLASTDSAPLMMVLASRPDSTSLAWRGRATALTEYSHRALEFRLGPLATEACDEIVALIDAESRLPLSARRALTVQAEGNPLFLEQLSREALELATARPTEALDIEDIALPAEVQTLLLARIDRLGVEARTALQVAAVCGRSFSLPVVVSVVGHKLTESFKQALRAGIVREERRGPHITHGFTHGLLREATLGTLTPKRVSEIHGRVAKVIEALPEFEGRLDLVANHYVASDDREKALEYLEKAAVRAASLSCVDESLGLLDTARLLAMELGNHRAFVRLTSHAAELLHSAGRFGDALDYWSLILATEEDSQLRGRLLTEIASTRFEMGDAAGAEEACDKALACSCTERDAAQALIWKARIALRRGDYRLTEHSLMSAEQVPKAVLEASQRFELSSLWAGFLVETGDIDGAQSWADNSLSEATENGDIGRILKARRDLGVIALVRGDLRSARVLLEEVYEQATEAGLLQRVFDAVSNLVYVCRMLGELDRARSLAYEVEPFVEPPFWRGALLLNLGMVEFELDRLTQARVLLGQCLDVVQGDDFSRLTSIQAGLVLAQISMVEGDFERAEAAARCELERGLQLAGRPELEVAARVVLGEIALAIGDIEMATSQACLAESKLSGAEVSACIRANVLIGRLACRSAKGAGTDVLREALSRAREAGTRIDEARAFMALGVSERSEEHFNAARNIFIACDCQRGLSELAAARSTALSDGLTR